VLSQVLTQVLAFHVFHHHKRAAVLQAVDVERRDHVRVVEFLHDHGFGPETILEVRGRLPEHLKGAIIIEVSPAHLPNGGETASPKLPHHLILLADHGTHFQIAHHLQGAILLTERRRVSKQLLAFGANLHGAEIRKQKLENGISKIENRNSKVENGNRAMPTPTSNPIRAG
jgi:hypothetical protein